MATLEHYAKRDWSVHPAAAPSQRLVPLKQTLSEVTGPVFGHNTVKKIDAGEKLTDEELAQLARIVSDLAGTASA